MTALGVIGYGNRAGNVLHVLREADPRVSIAAVADPHADHGRAPDARWFDSAEDMLASVALDGVLIGTRCDLHAPMAATVLRRGLPLFLEKPVAIDRDQLTELRRAALGASAPVVVSFPLRMAAVIRRVKALLEAGAIGELGQVQAVNNVPEYGVEAYYHGWMRDEAITGGLWLQKATHDFDYLNYLVGAQPVEVTALESKTFFRGDQPAGLLCRDCELAGDCPESPVNVAARDDLVGNVPPEAWRCAFGVDTGNHDSASAIVRYESGVQVAYSQNFYSRKGAARRGATLIGYRGTLRFDFYSGVIEVEDHFTGAVRKEQTSTEEAHFGGDAAMAAAFLAACRGEQNDSSPLSAGILSVAMCLAARESCRTARVVRVSDQLPELTAAAAR
ncbi:hypothetical protein GCM10009804_70840 [Kribbella hippodromi]|uniref:Gfo/Idh/MocA family oxidoreductase n=1 Tax=Kribbella hippodromi TaxID=434347 RepID=A0ABN2EDX5_9ACTN